MNVELLDSDSDEARLAAVDTLTLAFARDPVMRWFYIAYLESSNPANISLYQRHGFEAIGEIQIGEVPVVTPMRRPAH